MSDADPNPTVGRRNLLGRGAALAGTAAGAIALGVAGARPARAADGDPVVAGGSTTAATTTTLTKEGVQGLPALVLTHSTGPALRLTPVDTDLDFQNIGTPGDLFVTNERPICGGRDEFGDYSVGLATLDDLDTLSQPFVTGPSRIVDTRRNAGGLLDPKGLDASGRLRGGQYVDVIIGVIAEDYTLDAAMLNVTSTEAVDYGILSVYPPGPRPSASVLNYKKSSTSSNFCVIATGVVDPYFVVRVWSSATTHLVVDLQGVLQSGLPSYPRGSNLRRNHRTRLPRSAARRVKAPARRR